MSQELTYPISDKDVIGKSTWTVLHQYATTFPDSPTEENKQEFKSLMRAVLRGIPDSEPCKCRSHAIQWIQENPPDQHMTDSGTLFAYTCNFHNSVNARLGKKQHDCASLYRRTSNNDECPSCSKFPNTPEVNQSNEQTPSGEPSGTPTQVGNPTVVHPDLTSVLSDFKGVSKKVIEELCHQDKVPVPEIKFQPCPQVPETSCTSILRDPVSKKHLTKGVIYLHPNVFALRTLVHEYIHYLESYRMNDEIALNEYEVEKRAQEILTKEFPYDTKSKMTLVPVITATDTIAKVDKPVRKSFLQRQEEKRMARRAKFGFANKKEQEGTGAVVIPVSSPSPSMEPGLEGRYPVYTMVRSRFDQEQQMRAFQEEKDGAGEGGFFSGFDKIYEPIASRVAIPARTLNESLTAEFISSALTTIAKSNLSPIGSLLLTGLTSLGLFGTTFLLKNNTYGVSLGDRKMLMHITGSLMMSNLTYLNPKVNKRLIHDAKELGHKAAGMDFKGMFPILVESPFYDKMFNKHTYQATATAGGGTATATTTSGARSQARSQQRSTMGTGQRQSIASQRQAQRQRYGGSRYSAGGGIGGGYSQEISPAELARQAGLTDIFGGYPSGSGNVPSSTPNLPPYTSRSPDDFVGVPGGGGIGAPMQSQNPFSVRLEEAEQGLALGRKRPTMYDWAQREGYLPGYDEEAIREEYERSTGNPFFQEFDTSFITDNDKMPFYQRLRLAERLRGVGLLREDPGAYQPFHYTSPISDDEEEEDLTMGGDEELPYQYVLSPEEEEELYGTSYADLEGAGDY